MDNIEYRNFNLELRGEDESRHIEGYGSVFNSRSLDLGGFQEIIAPGAFDGVILMRTRFHFDRICEVAELGDVRRVK